MAASLIHTLIGVTIASSLALLLVGLLRKPLRAVAGPRAAYWLWLLVPAIAMAILPPAPSIIVYRSSGYMVSVLSSVTAVSDHPYASPTRAIVGLAIWGVGAAAMLGLLLRRQRAFIQSLGTLTPGADHTQRSSAIAAPMLVGAWRSVVILPVDFETRYSEVEQELILAHERAHLLRRDVFINMVAAGWLCFFWFNPLIYWAIGRLRLDQELACDAVALARTGAARQCYADALLKTQLASESGWHMPIGCRWQSGHPLKERIAMLRRHAPGSSRRLGGIAFVFALTLSGSYAAWAAQSLTEDKGPQILVDIQLTTWIAKSPPRDPPATDVHVIATEYLVNSGQASDYWPNPPFDFRCTPFLPRQDGPAPAPTKQGSGGIPAPVSGQIFLRCEIRYNGEAVATPAVLVEDGQPTTLKVDDAGRSLSYELKVSATTSEERMRAAAPAAAAARAKNAAAGR